MNQDGSISHLTSKDFKNPQEMSSQFTSDLFYGRPLASIDFSEAPSRDMNKSLQSENYRVRNHKRNVAMVNNPPQAFPERKKNNFLTEN